MYCLNSEIAFALKDSSTLHILEGEFKNNNICGEIYQKKQEFGYSKLFIDPNVNCKIDKEDFSETHNFNICKFVNRNFFFSTCITSVNHVRIDFKNNFPKNSALEFSYDSDGINRKITINFNDIIKEKCSNNLKNCIFELNLNEKFANNKINNFYVKLIDKKYGYYFTEKYTLNIDL